MSDNDMSHNESHSSLITKYDNAVSTSSGGSKKTACKTLLPCALLPLLLLSAYMGFSFYIISSSLMPSSYTTQIPKEEPYKRKTIERKSHEFPYPLTCSTKPRHNPKSPKRFNVAITYHVGMVNNWKTILHDQMYTLHQCGLGDLVDKFILSYSNGEVEEVLYELSNYSFAANPDIIVESVKAPWEGAAMNAMREFCLTTTTNTTTTTTNTGTAKQQQKQRQKPTVVFYFHNDKHHDDDDKHRHREATTETAAEAHGSILLPQQGRLPLRFRLGTAEHRSARQKLRALLVLAQVHGILPPGTTGNVPPSHPEGRGEDVRDDATYGIHADAFSGNFWSASCDHVGELDPMAEDGGFYAAEFWVNSKGKRSEWACLDNARSRIPGENRDPYFQLVLPEDYWNRTENLLTTNEMEELFS
eukprot:CAMPEP_0201622780 /NCGR_PEP_ID=MMETSP0492-20130828/47574_1 /ASSEMBLY_ACC=CAM_ASM_000837 /TAXON_ID=420259 /ORGANISM="Thalassiosira gravida, Strain GMp14c1" /LENGTH=415 /DNA_ID=CAMNT_0048092371 /DNA_START=23 /DNA_END=1272 /DNA_ORIENTATION=-